MTKIRFKLLSKTNKWPRFEKDLLLSVISGAVYSNSAFAALEDKTWSLAGTFHAQHASLEFPHGRHIPDILKTSNARPDPPPHLLGDDHRRGKSGPEKSPGCMVRQAAKMVHFQWWPRALPIVSFVFLLVMNETITPGTVCTSSNIFFLYLQCCLISRNWSSWL